MWLVGVTRKRNRRRGVSSQAAVQSFREGERCKKGKDDRQNSEMMAFYRGKAANGQAPFPNRRRGVAGSVGRN